MVYLPETMIPRHRHMTEADVFVVDAWVRAHPMSWDEREDCRRRMREAINASPLITSFSLRELNRPRVFRGTVAMMNWIVDGRVMGHYDSTTKISQGIAAVNFRWHMTRSWLRTQRGKRIVVLACGIAREIDHHILSHNRVTLIDGYPDSDTADRLGVGIQRMNVFKDDIPEYDILVCLGLLDYVPPAKKVAVMRRWESFGAPNSAMLVGQVRDSDEMKRIHTSMNWPLYTWDDANSPYPVYTMNDTYYMMCHGVSPEEIQRGLTGGALRYDFIRASL